MVVLEGERGAVRRKRNVVLYLDKELVEKSGELGFNLSKPFENHSKCLITQFSTGHSTNSFELTKNKTYSKMVGRACLVQNSRLSV
jgi:hypothetical protein